VNLQRFFVRVMTLDADELAREAKEVRHNGYGNALTYAAMNIGMEVAIELIQRAWADFVNAKDQ
jgi:hypothetical protein